MSTKELKRKGYADAAEIWDDPRAKHSAKSGKNNIRPFWLIKSQPMNKKEMKRKEKKRTTQPLFSLFLFPFFSLQFFSDLTFWQDVTFTPLFLPNLLPKLIKEKETSDLPTAPCQSNDMYCSALSACLSYVAVMWLHTWHEIKWFFFNIWSW